MVKVFLLVTRVEDYYTSLTPVGIYSTFDKAIDKAHEMFTEIRQNNTEQHSWIWDDHIISKLPEMKNPSVFQMRAINEFEEGCTEFVDIAVIEYEIN